MTDHPTRDEVERLACRLSETATVHGAMNRAFMSLECTDAAAMLRALREKLEAAEAEVQRQQGRVAIRDERTEQMSDCALDWLETSEGFVSIPDGYRIEEIPIDEGYRLFFGATDITPYDRIDLDEVKAAAAEHCGKYHRARSAPADWRDDPAADDRWCAGNDFALSRLCAVLKVDPHLVDWDGSDNSLQDEADALILRILNAQSAPATPADDLRDHLKSHITAVLEGIRHLSVDDAADVLAEIADDLAEERSEDLINGAILDGIRWGYTAAVAVEMGGGAMLRAILPGGCGITHQWADEAVAQPQIKAALEGLHHARVNASNAGDE